MTTKLPDEHIAQSIERIMPRGSYNNTTNCQAIALKVKEDIHFLQDRIERIKKLQTPNSSVLKTYQSMLESREAVYLWLQENAEIEDTQHDDDISDVG